MYVFETNSIQRNCELPNSPSGNRSKNTSYVPVFDHLLQLTFMPQKETKMPNLGTLNYYATRRFIEKI